MKKIKTFLNKELYRKNILDKERVLKVWHVSVILIVFGSLAGDPCDDYAGTYSGSSRSGSITGTASVDINSDCSCTYSMDLGSYGSSVEDGRLIKEDNGSYNYKFLANNGFGKYPVYLSKTTMKISHGGNDASNLIK